MVFPDGKRERLRELASSAMDGNIDELQRAELNAILRDDPEARDEYLALVDLHTLLATELAANPTPLDATHSAVVTSEREEPLTRRRTFRLVAVLALAASVLIAITLVGLREPDSPSFVTLARINNAVWLSQQIEVGNRTGPTTMRLASGLVRLEYDSGVEVTVEGPAEFELIHESQGKLKSGVLTATVPEGAEGFTVKTPTAEVIDLGTAFGIDLREDGISNVSVFDGEVEVAVDDRTQKHLLSEGESISISSDSKIESIGFNTKPFERLWLIASGIKESTETIQLLPPWSRKVRLIQSDDHLFVAPERHAINLKEPLTVNVSEPGQYARLSELTPAEIAAGESVRSFLLHYSPLEQAGPRQADRMVGSITFDQPVLGLIVLHEELLESSQRFSRRGAGEANPRRELQLSGDANGDRISLSEDRKTITVDLVSPGRSSDLVRVIVESRPRRRGSRPHRRGARRGQLNE